MYPRTARTGCIRALDSRGARMVFPRAAGFRERRRPPQRGGVAGALRIWSLQSSDTRRPPTWKPKPPRTVAERGYVELVPAASPSDRAQSPNFSFFTTLIRSGPERRRSFFGDSLKLRRVYAQSAKDGSGDLGSLQGDRKPVPTTGDSRLPDPLAPPRSPANPADDGDAPTFAAVLGEK